MLRRQILAPGKDTEFSWCAGKLNSQVVVGYLRLGLGKWAKVEFQGEVQSTERD